MTVATILFASMVRKDPGPSNCWITGLHAILAQGQPHEPDPFSSRIVFLVMFAQGAMVWYHYSATLTSFLAANVEKIPFNNLEDMLYRTNYRIVAREGFNLEADYLKVITPRSYSQCRLMFELQKGGPVKNEIFKVRFYTRPTFEGIIKELEEEPEVAAMIETTAAEDIVGQSCKYKWIPKWKIRTLYGFFLQKESPLKPLLNNQ